MGLKITCERGYLASCIGITSRGISSRNTLPILSNVLLETSDDRLTMTATDLDASIRAVVPVTVHKNGAIAIPAKTLNDVISKLPDAPVTITDTDGRVTLRSGKSDYSILALQAIDFPVTPFDIEGTDIVVPQGQLKTMLRQTAFAASKEESRSILMGALFDFRDGCLTVVATDTHRLALSRRKFDSKTPPVKMPPVSAIIPARTLIEIERTLRDDDEVDVRFRVGSSQVRCDFGDVTFVSRLLDGQFPNYEKVIPKNAERKITMEREALLHSLSRVDIVARANSQKTIFGFKDDLVTLRAESQDVGKAYEEVRANIDGEPLDIAFNTTYFLHVLTMLDCKEITLNLNGALNPGVITIAGDDNRDFLYVVMPMQV
jgi:DNA polymerase-3 subunit beta